MGVLDGKNALVTGASRGIGAAIAETFGREGANVIVNYHQSEQAALKVADAIARNGSRARALQADTTIPQDLRALFDRSEAAFGGLDIVVLNAHPGHVHVGLTQVEETDVDLQLAALKSYIIGMQEAGRRVREGGVIICISSSSTRVAKAEIILYGAVKLAIEHLSKGLSQELSSKGVRVVSLAPGLTLTDRLAASGIDFTGFPTCDPEDIAASALFLASDAARRINTHTLFVNGGIAYAQ